MTGLLVALKSIGINLLWSILSKKFLEWGMWKFAEALVKSTKTTNDDEGLQKLKATYEEISKGK